MDKSDPSYKGQSGYNAAMLAIYDVWVLKFMTKAVWKVPLAQGVDRYRQYMGHRHLDVGPGTGYFIEKADPPRDTEITLLDPNQTVLRHVAKRLEERHPITVEADVMKPLPVDGPFDSAALSFVLHCLRGPMTNKATAIRNIADVLTPDGVLFGGTVPGSEGSHTSPARVFLWAFNRRGDFDNLEDTVDGLHRHGWTLDSRRAVGFKPGFLGSDFPGKVVWHRAPRKHSTCVEAWAQATGSPQTCDQTPSIVLVTTSRSVA